MGALLLEYRAFVQYLLIFALTAYAFRRGDGPEKWAGATLSAMVLLDILYRTLVPAGNVYNRIDYGLLAIDLAVFASLGLLAIRANRIYPLWMFAAQIISTMTHFNRELSADMEPIAYFVLARAPSYIQIIALLCGLVAHRRRIRRFGTYRSWRNS